MVHSASGAWQTAADISTTLGVVIALVGVILTFVFTLRSQRLTRDGQAQDREQASNAAARSEAAAALTEEYTRRVVDALETMARHEDLASGLLTVPQGVRWSLTHHSGDTYQLENDGDTTAWDVRVTAHESLTFFPPDQQTIEPGGAMTFMASLSMATTDSTITVQWAEDDRNTLKTWRYPLPPR